MTTKIKVCLDTWDDPAFRAAFEEAYQTATAEGVALDTPDAGSRVQHLLAAAGFPDVHIEVERTPTEALEHLARWTVKRGG